MLKANGIASLLATPSAHRKDGDKIGIATTYLPGFALNAVLNTAVFMYNRNKYLKNKDSGIVCRST
jgi:hypothetical protein